MTVTVRQLAEWVRGEVLGDGDLAISNARTLSEAQPGDITFLESERRLTDWHSSQASAAIVPPTVPVNGRPVIRVTDPLMAFARIVQHLRGRPDLGSERKTGGIDPTAIVHPTAVIGANAAVGPHAAVGERTEVGDDCTILAGAIVGRGCKLGSGVTLHPHVVLYDDCVLGDRVTVHANSVVGSDGFGYRTLRGEHVKVPQLGWVEVGDDVEIGACSTIDRGTFGPTRIGRGTKIDNLVMIAHNCQIGRHNIFVGQVGIAGSVTTGDYVVMAGQAGVCDNLSIGDRVVLGAKTGAVRDIPSDLRMLGMPATPEKEEMRIWLTMDKLPEMYRDLKKIKQALGMEEP